MSDETKDEVRPIVEEEFDIESFDFVDEEVEFDPGADAFAPYQLAPAGLYLAKIGYYDKETGIRKVTFPAKVKGQPDVQALKFTADMVLLRPFESKLADRLAVEDYENQHVFFRGNSLRRRDNGASKFTALLQCADPELMPGKMHTSQIVQQVDIYLKRGFEGVIEIDWKGYNSNTKKGKKGMSSFPIDKTTGKRIARYRDSDGTQVDGQLEVIRLVPAAALASLTA